MFSRKPQKVQIGGKHSLEEDKMIREAMKLSALEAEKDRCLEEDDYISQVEH